MCYNVGYLPVGERNMRKVRSVLVLGLLGVLTAACGGSFVDICGTDTRCSGAKANYLTYNLGNSYKKGEGVEKDLAKANQLYRMAAETGNDEVQLQPEVANEAIPLVLN